MLTISNYKKINGIWVPGMEKDTVLSRQGRLRAECQLQRMRDMQYIMGHSDIGVTLNTYTHISYEDASREKKKVSSRKSR